MATPDLVLAAVPALILGAGALYWLRRAPPAAPTLPAPPEARGRWPAAALPVLAPEALIQATGSGPALLDIRRRSGLTDPTWETHVAPVARAVAAFMQQLPASESHHHAQPGGLWIHTIETLGHAARLRQGRILPPGADIETQGRTQHLWTVGIYIAALLHDIGKPVTDLRVTLHNAATPAGWAWQALTGSMADAGAEAYVVGFAAGAERDYQAHQRIGVQLLQRFVPTPTLIWLSSEKPLFDQLFEYLSGGTQGPIAEIVRESEAESVRRNLLIGTRVRFASAKATPLIELLMQALRAMLAEGGRLPLNRPGAAGFFDGTDIWFAATRLANEVRDWLKHAYPEAPVPGETMNDRLFDTWQEYNACVTNPDTQGAIWAARLEFDSGQSFSLGALLRFPVGLLYPDASLYPLSMAGRIVVAGRPETPAAMPASPAPIPEARAEAPISATGAMHLPPPGDGGAAAADKPGQGADPPARPGATLPTPAASAPARRNAPAKVPVPEADSITAPRLPNVNLGAALKALRKPAQEAPKPSGVAPAPIAPADKPAPVARQATPAAPAVPEFLEPANLDDDPAAAIQVGRAPPRYTGAVVPHVALPPPTDKKKPGKGGKATPSDTALRFMGWLQQGVADGSLPYNTQAALVHFVRVKLRDEREETMMLLVSPAVFRRFAETYGDTAEGGESADDKKPNPTKVGMGVQMAFTRAGWHQPAGKGRNVHRFQVVRRGDSGGSLLNGFLVVEPERFVNPVPPANDRLSYWSQHIGGALAAEAGATP